MKYYYYYIEYCYNKITKINNICNNHDNNLE